VKRDDARGFGRRVERHLAGHGRRRPRRVLRRSPTTSARRGSRAYRSGDFGELRAYEGRLAALGVPALVLWGEATFAPGPRAPVRARSWPGAELVVLEGSGTSSSTTTRATSAAVVNFLSRRAATG